ncbi:hypothetical protein CPAR01_15939 [Colletotrichum paranaense]|uniref:Uncharacterized protein n=1 Tax=Colletotrichum paranaense TaxID=1914294 RepID=A0ABQ9RX58_9PEZI|nr:uncharacterized protein CPAR01_15939 [Colletotrichum paranaense]KAK1517459.1 hypothetical protein CPAR01_15939 [Colletotrichum paranaense]
MPFNLGITAQQGHHQPPEPRTLDMTRLSSDLSTRSAALAAFHLPSSLNRPFDPPLRVASEEPKTIDFAKVTLPNREDQGTLLVLHCKYLLRPRSRAGNLRPTDWHRGVWPRTPATSVRHSLLPMPSLHLDRYRDWVQEIFPRRKSIRRLGIPPRRLDSLCGAFVHKDPTVPKANHTT